MTQKIFLASPTSVSTCCFLGLKRFSYTHSVTLDNEFAMPNIILLEGNGKNSRIKIKKTNCISLSLQYPSENAYREVSVKGFVPASNYPNLPSTFLPSLPLFSLPHLFFPDLSSPLPSWRVTATVSFSARRNRQCNDVGGIHHIFLRH